MSEKIQYDDLKTLEETIRRAKCLMISKKQGQCSKKLGKTKKFKMDQRKKGTKTPFFRNNPQGQPTSREPRTIETGGQRPRQPPIQCWGCK
jgi:hypothetical protein